MHGQEVAKRTTTYKAAVEEQGEEDDDSRVDASEENLFHQQVSLAATLADAFC